MSLVKPTGGNRDDFTTIAFFIDLLVYLGFVNFIPASSKFFFVIFKLSNCNQLDLISTVVSSFYMLDSHDSIEH